MQEVPTTYTCVICRQQLIATVMGREDPQIIGVKVDYAIPHPQYPRTLVSIERLHCPNCGVMYAHPPGLPNGIPLEQRQQIISQANEPRGSEA